MASRIARPDTAFSTSPVRGRRPRVHSEAHLRFIRSLPCLATGARHGVEAAHIRYAEPRAGKRQTGMSEKPSDQWTVPLCAGKHRLDNDAQHNMNERAFWARLGIDPIYVSLALWACSGDVETAEIIIREARMGARGVRT